MRHLALGFAAVVALSATALLPTAASAGPKGWHRHQHHGFHGHWSSGPRFIVSGGYNGGYVKRLETRYGLRYRVVEFQPWSYPTAPGRDRGRDYFRRGTSTGGSLFHISKFLPIAHHPNKSAEPISPVRLGPV
jgi:hypothetical protein